MPSRELEAGSPISEGSEAGWLPAHTAHPAPVHLVEGREPILAMLHDAWVERRLLPQLGARMFTSLGGGAKLGRWWLLIRPAMQIFGMALLFGGVLHISTGPSDIPYIVFLLVGLLAWSAFDRVAFWATRSFDRYRRHVAVLHFPLIYVPIAGSWYAAIQEAIIAMFLVVIVPIVWLTDGTFPLHLGWNTLLLLPGLALGATFGLTVGIVLSILNARWRDVRLTLRFVLQIWLFATPVIYPVTQLPDWLKPFATINPVTAPVEMVKAALIGGAVEERALLCSLIATSIMLVFSVVFFDKYSTGFWRTQARAAEPFDDDAL